MGNERAAKVVAFLNELDSYIDLRIERATADPHDMSTWMSETVTRRARAGLEAKLMELFDGTN